jgi:hypothetical protein
MNHEKLNELMNKFKSHGINKEHKKGLQDVIDWQDVIGRSNAKGWRDAWTTFDQQKKELFTWANFVCLAYDSALEVFKQTAGAAYKNKLAETMELELNAAIEKYRKDFGERKKNLITNLDARERAISLEENRIDEIVRLQKDIKYLQARNLELQTENADLVEAAEKYNQIKDLLK